MKFVLCSLGVTSNMSSTSGGADVGKIGMKYGPKRSEFKGKHCQKSCEW